MEDIFVEIRDKIIQNAKAALESEGAQIQDEHYRAFLTSLSQGVCPICGLALQVVYAEESAEQFRYRYACGHGWAGVTLKDNFTIKESLKLKKTKIGTRKFILESIQGWFPSKRKDLSPKGVRKIRIVDRERDYYKEEVIDEVTGRVIRYVEEKLSDHKKKSERP